jgi:uncharacterized protein
MSDNNDQPQAAAKEPDELSEAPALRLARKRSARIAYGALGVLCVGLGIIGVIVPGMPTTVFLIVALWAFSRSSEKLHHWLYDHPRFGKALRNWQQHRIIPRRAKIAATATMALSLVILWLTTRNGWLELGVSVILVAVALWLVTRAERPPAS